MPAMVTLRRGYLPDLVQRLKSRKKPTMVILGAIMRKLAVIAFNLYKKGENTIRIGIRPSENTQKAKRICRKVKHSPLKIVTSIKNDAAKIINKIIKL